MGQGYETSLSTSRETLNILSRKAVRRGSKGLTAPTFLRFFHGGLRATRSAAVSALFLRRIGYCEREACDSLVRRTEGRGCSRCHLRTSKPAVSLFTVLMLCFYPKAVIRSTVLSFFRRIHGLTVGGTHSPDHGERAASSSAGLQVDVRRGSLHSRRGGDGEQPGGSGQGRARERECALLVLRVPSCPPFCRTRNGVVEGSERSCGGAFERAGITSPVLSDRSPPSLRGDRYRPHSSGQSVVFPVSIHRVQRLFSAFFLGMVSQTRRWQDQVLRSVRSGVSVHVLAPATAKTHLFLSFTIRQPGKRRGVPSVAPFLSNSKFLVAQCTR